MSTSLGNSLLLCLFLGLSTGVGALPSLFTDQIKERTYTVLMGFGAGVMLSAAIFSLIIPAIEMANLYFTIHQWSVFSGILAGTLFLFLIDRLLPHEHFFKGREGAEFKSFKRIWLFVLAIAIHNFPEGLSVGVGFAGSEFTNPDALLIGIIIQNFPEGLITALSLRSIGYSKNFSFWMATLTGLVETIGALVGLSFGGLSHEVISFALSFAGGAMIAVVSHEVIPESHQKGHEKLATLSLMVGFILMIKLDLSF